MASELSGTAGGLPENEQTAASQPSSQSETPPAEAGVFSSAAPPSEPADSPDEQPGGSPPPGGPSNSRIIYCVRCGAVMGGDDQFCHACGWNAQFPLPAARIEPNPSERSRLAALLLCVLLGWLGAHRFYVGKVGSGLLWLFTIGLLGMGVIFDLVLIATGEFRDQRDRRLVYWE
jgi:TM2 domain-containing membrane protein YozV